MTKSQFFLKRNDEVIEITFEHHRVYINEKLNVLSMSIERFNHYVKLNHYQVIERSIIK